MLQPLDKLWSAVIGAELSDLLLGQDKKPNKMQPRLNTDLFKNYKATEEQRKDKRSRCVFI